VRLGVPLDFFGRDFTTWLARFKNRHPMVGLEIEANQSENLMKRSMRGEFDLAFFKQETGAKNGTVALREQLVWVSGPNYSGDDNQSVPLILFPEGCAYRRFAIAALKDHTRAWHLSFVSPSFECLKSAAVEGMGNYRACPCAGRAAAADRPPWHASATVTDGELSILTAGGATRESVSELASYLADSFDPAPGQGKGYVGAVAENIARYHRKNRRPLQ